MQKLCRNIEIYEHNWNISYRKCLKKKLNNGVNNIIDVVLCPSKFFCPHSSSCSSFCFLGNCKIKDLINQK